MYSKKAIISSFKKYWLYYGLIILLTLCTILLLLAEPKTVSGTFSGVKSIKSKKDKVIICVLESFETTELKRNWKETAVYLNNQIKDREFMIKNVNYKDFETVMENEEIDFFIISPSLYVELEFTHGISRVLTMKMKIGDRGYNQLGGVIFTATDKDIQSLEELKSKRILAVSENSFAGWHVVCKEFYDIGVNPEKFLQEITFLGNQSDVVKRVLSGEYDVGVIRTGILEKMVDNGSIEMEDIRLINSQTEPSVSFALSTALYPEWVLARSNQVEAELVFDVALALMNLKASDTAAIEAEITGWTIPENYRIVENLMRSLEMEPFEHIRQISFTEFIIQYKWFFIIIFISLIIFFLYEIRYRWLAEKTSEALERSRKMENLANESSKAKSMFLANMSHEIRTPMNAIIGLSDLMFKTDLNAKQLDYNKKLYSSAKSLLGIINNILDFSKIEAGKMELENELFSFDEIVYNLSNLLSLKAEKKGIELLFDIDNDIPGQLKGDALKLTQVMTNLINNSLKFTDEGHILVRISAQCLDSKKLKLNVVIEDTGIGMKEAQVKKLFSAFTQADVSTTRRFGGTGLGLTISKQIIELMEGSISVESTYGKGSTFIFDVYLEYDSDSEFNLKKRVFLDELQKVLIVDDNSESRAIVRHILEGFGFSVFEAKSGEEALNILLENTFTLIILDYRMPGMSGIETAQKIQLFEKGNNVDIPKIMMISAYGRDEIKKEAEISGIERFLDKPVNASHLYNSLLEILGREGVSKPGFAARNLSRKKNMAIFKGAKLLLVEDNAINQQVAYELLSDEGFSVVIANNGLEAVNTLKKSVKGDFDAVLMDVQMPLMDGREATEYIRKMGGYFKELPIIALTAHAFSEEKEKNFKCGMTDQVNKPIDVNEIFEVLSKYIQPAYSPEIVEDLYQEIDETENEINIEGIEVYEGLERVLNNLELYEKLLKDFKIELDNADTIFLKNKRINDYRSCEILIHSLKGSGANLGANQLASSAAELEQSLKHKDWNESLYKDFVLHLKIVSQGIQTYFEEKEVLKGIEQDSSIEIVSLEDYEEALHRLSAMLKSYDSEAIEEAKIIYDKLNESLKKEFKEILENTDELQYEEAIQLLNLFLKKYNLYDGGD